MKVEWVGGLYLSRGPGTEGGGPCGRAVGTKEEAFSKESSVNKRRGRGGGNKEGSEVREKGGIALFQEGETGVWVRAFLGVQDREGDVFGFGGGI